MLVLREIEQRLGIAERLAGCIDDPRAQAQVVHGLDEMIRFRMLMIASGYEDGNDATTMRSDPAFKLAGVCLPLPIWPLSRPFHALRIGPICARFCAWEKPWPIFIAHPSPSPRADRA